VPASAIVPQDNKNYVVVYKGKDDLSIALVDILKTVGDKTFIKSGVTPGQVVITKHQLFIFNQLSEE